MNAIINNQPDIFNDESLHIVLQILSKKPSDDLILLVLQHLKNATLMHELNRQNILNANILDHLKPLLKYENPNVINQCIILIFYVSTII